MMMMTKLDSHGKETLYQEYDEKVKRGETITKLYPELRKGLILVCRRREKSQVVWLPLSRKNRVT